MSDNKTVFLSGKLNGTKTLENELLNIQNPDLYEKFLIEFINIKFEIKTDNEVIYINDDQDFEEKVLDIEKSEYASIFVNQNFNRIYITTDERKTFSIRLNKINPLLISNLISKEKPKKFLLNSFSFVKWCNEKQIDIRNIYDIPTFIKILTNNIEVDNTLEYYIEKYTNQKLIEDDNELNNIIIGNFIYDFGKYLEKYINEFELINLCKIINENAYYESLNIVQDSDCIITFSYYNLDENIKMLISRNIEEFKEKAYILSPTGRIALKFSRNENELMKEIYLEDLEILILNELYNNNINAKIIGDNLYRVNCKAKSFNHVSSIILAILKDVFNNVFNEEAKIKIEGIV